MARLTTLAKGTAAFLVLAVGVSFIIGSLMGGGFSSRSYDDSKRLNDDPRSILVQAVLVESDTPLPASLPMAGTPVSDAGFKALLSDADALHASGAARVRAPAVLIQHAEQGAIGIKIGDRNFRAAFSPHVIDTKNGPVLRVAMQILRDDTDSSNAGRSLTFETAYTAAPGSAVVLDLAGMGDAGTNARLALRTSLIALTPTAAN
ncbi:MAG: hypothetical protein D6692_05470 [Planctomycetota bacterium]|nr:MAG: hypothetical protein D6692_05470 [Planctomycetota bacterium]